MRGWEPPTRLHFAARDEREETGKETNTPISKSREKRAADGPPRGYDEVKRRKARRTYQVGYVEKGSRARNGGLKRAMEVGATTIERIVKRRYEWRDGGLRSR